MLSADRGDEAFLYLPIEDAGRLALNCLLEDETDCPAHLTWLRRKHMKSFESGRVAQKA